MSAPPLTSTVPTYRLHRSQLQWGGNMRSIRNGFVATFITCLLCGQSSNAGALGVIVLDPGRAVITNAELTAVGERRLRLAAQTPFPIRSWAPS